MEERAVFMAYAQRSSGFDRTATFRVHRALTGATMREYLELPVNAWWFICSVVEL